MGKNVVHVSHVRLPDPRIERIACLEKKYLGHRLIYIGGGYGRCFNEIIEYPKWIPSLEYSHRKKVAFFLRDIIREYNPDYVHVHDIFAAYAVIELDIDFIYNDHELHYIKNKDVMLTYLSPGGFRRYVGRLGVGRLFTEIFANFFKYIGNRFMLKKIVGSSSAIVTVSPVMKKIYEEALGASNVFVVPNFPIADELPDLRLILDGIEKRGFSRILRLIYTTGSFRGDVSAVVPYRDIRDVFGVLDGIGDVVIDVYTGDGETGMADMFRNVYLKGSLPRHRLVAALAAYHAGLVPFRPSLTHIIGGSNKAVEYLHAGLPVILPSSYTGLLMLLSDFKELMYIYNSVDHVSLMKLIGRLRDFYANAGAAFIKEKIGSIRKSLVMDNYVDELKKIYSI